MATGRVPTTANSPLTAKGDLFGYSTTQARVAVGNNGETLVADSSTTTGLRWNPSPTLANPVINGGFDIWQRNTSAALGGAGTVTAADRWATYSANGSGTTISRQTTSDTTNLPTIQYAARIQRNSGQTNLSELEIGTSLETANTFPYIGQTITLSFYARRGANYSAASNAFNAFIRTGTGTDQSYVAGSYTGTATPLSTTVTLTTTWQRFTVTGTIASTATEMAVDFRWTPTGTAGVNDWAEVTGVQIDLGSIALPFRRAGGTLAGELAACQRYYYRQTGRASGRNEITTGWANSTTSAIGILRLPVTMRVAPTMSQSAAGDYGFIWSGGLSTITAVAYDEISIDTVAIRLTTSGLTTGQGGALTIPTGATKWFEASAEL